jgi:Protein of unknown function (DUF2855)
MKSTEFVVARHDLQQCEFIETILGEEDALPDEALLVKVDRFAFTANNVTYAQLGEQLKYWQLFPASDGFGKIPVWGFGEVIASRHPAVETGERLFGYFPMATHLVIEAGSVTRHGLRDAAAHRQDVGRPTRFADARATGGRAASTNGSAKHGRASGKAGLSRHAQRAYSARAGPHALPCGLRELSGRSQTV